MADCHDSNGASRALDGVYDPKTPNTKLMQSIEFAQQLVAGFPVGGDGEDGGFNISFQTVMKRADRV
jgi:hypothetical protein